MAADPRIPVIFVDPDLAAGALRADDALLVEDGLIAQPGGMVGTFALGVTAHLIGCRCCAGRSPPASALSSMFLARARGDAVFFRRVIAVVRDRALVRRLLEDDVNVRARFKVEAEPSPG